MATELAKAYVQIIPSAVGIQGRIQKEIEPEADSAGSSFGGKMVGMIKRLLPQQQSGKLCQQASVKVQHSNRVLVESKHYLKILPIK